MQKILVIEDNLDVRENIVEILELSNYEVVEAPNGKEGVKAAKNEHPDLILCDIMMPEMDGYEVLYMLGKDPNTSTIPFIFLTAKSEKSDFRQGMSLGADDYLTKPFDDMELLKAIEGRLDKYDKLKSTSEAKGPDDFLTGLSGVKSLEVAAAQDRRYAKQDIIFRDGDFPHYLFYIVSGKVKTYKISEEGKEFILSVLGPGEYFGYRALLLDSNHTEFTACLEDVELKLITRDSFHQLVFADKHLSASFVKQLANEVSEKESELLHLAYDTVRKRVVDKLLMLADSYEGEEYFRVVRNDLAGLVGTASESVIRILSEFKKEGVIDIKSHGIKILDRKKLEAVKW